MSEQITTAAELDALPVGSVVLDAYAASCTLALSVDDVPFWRRVTTAVMGGEHRHSPYLPATLLYHPDAPVTAGGSVTRGVALIAAERQRQIAVEGYTAEHDAGHDPEDLARAAVCYATRPGRRFEHDGLPPFQLGWPWERRSWKPTPNDRVRELVKAGALIAAAIDALTVVDGPTEGGA